MTRHELREHVEGLGRVVATTIHHVRGTEPSRSKTREPEASIDDIETSNESFTKQSDRCFAEEDSPRWSPTVLQSWRKSEAFILTIGVLK